MASTRNFALNAVGSFPERLFLCLDLTTNRPGDKKAQALAFIEIRPAGVPASREPKSPLSLASQVQVADLSGSRLQGLLFFLFLPRDLLSLPPLSFPETQALVLGSCWGVSVG